MPIGDKGTFGHWDNFLPSLYQKCPFPIIYSLPDFRSYIQFIDFQVREYKRLTELKVEDSAVASLDNIQPGDCIVCFNKNDIYSVSRAIEQRSVSGVETGVIFTLACLNAKHIVILCVFYNILSSFVQRL